MRYHSREVFSAFADARLQLRCSGRVHVGSRSSWPRSHSESWVISPSHLGHTKISPRSIRRANSGDGGCVSARRDRARGGGGVPAASVVRDRSHSRSIAFVQTKSGLIVAHPENRGIRTCGWSLGAAPKKSPSPCASHTDFVTHVAS